MNRQQALLTISMQQPLPPPDGVRVSGGHLCEAEAPTEAVAETVGFARRQNSEGEKKLMVRTIYRLLSKLPLPTSNV